MSKWLKRIGIALGALVLLVVVAVITLPLLIDPNSFKPALRNVAAEQGLDLQLEGPISWQFYPDLGLALENITLAPQAEPDQALAQLERGVAAVQLLPLLRRQVRVLEIVIDGAAADLRINAEGEGNWSSIGAEAHANAQSNADETADSSARPLDISVESIRITNGRLRYRDARNEQDIELSELDIRLNDVNLAQRPIPIRAGFRLASSAPAVTLEAEASSTLRVDRELTEVELGNTELTLRFPDHEAATITAVFNADATLKPSLQYEGDFVVDPLNLKALLAALGQAAPLTAEEKALERASFSTRFAGSANQATLSDLNLSLDDTEFSGQAGWQQGEQRPALSLQLQGNAINVDHYLPPSEDTAEATPPPAAAPGADTPLPLEALRAFDLDLQLAMDQITAFNMPITSPSLTLKAKAGRWRLESLSADLYEGNLKAAGEMDARQDTADMEFAAQLENLAVQPLLQSLADFGDVSGSVTGQLVATARAATVNQVIEQSQAEFTFSSPALTLQGMNAEQYYCQMAARVNEDAEADTGKNWPQKTDITNVQGRLTFNNARLSIAALRADLGNLVVQGRGFVDLNEDAYRVRLPMLLAGDTTSAGGCRIDSKFLLEHEVDIVGCQGSLAEMNLGKQCGLDTEAVATLAKQAVRYNVQKRTDEKKQEVRDELKEKLREQLGDDEAETARDLLKNLLNR